MADAATERATAALLRVAAGILVVAALSWGREVLIPLALAILLSFVLAPAVNRLERLGLPNVPAVLVVTLLAFALLGGIGTMVSNQVLWLAESVPQYRENVKERLVAVRGGGGEALESAARAAEMVEEIQQEIETEEKERDGDLERRLAAEEPVLGPPRLGAHVRANAADGEAEAEVEPVPVVVREPEPSSFQLLRAWIGPLLSPLATAGIVVVFVIFFLVQRRDLRDRVIRLAGQGRLDVTTRAMNEAASRISRYLLAQLLVNASYGVPVAIGLWLLGVPGALLWGLLATVLRFLPYIGPWVAASGPILLAFAVFDGWTRPLAVVGLFLALELLNNNVMEPAVYGASTGMSAVAVLLAAVFWGWLWGGVGLLLAVPLTVCLVVLGKYVPQLEMFSILLGREPALRPAERFYQRLLAADEEEASRLLEDHLRREGVLRACDDLLLPALHLEESDRHGGRLEGDRRELVREAMRELVEDLEEWVDGDAPAALPAAEAGGVVCLPARDEADELAARLLAAVLAAEGVASRALPAARLAGEAITDVREAAPKVVCISALPPGALRRARYLAKRLEPLRPGPRVVVALWGWSGDEDRARGRLSASGADAVATTIEEAAERVRRALGREAAPAA